MLLCISLHNLNRLISAIITDNDLKVRVIHGRAGLKDAFGHLSFIIKREVNRDKGMSFQLNMIQGGLKSTCRRRLPFLSVSSITIAQAKNPL